MYANQPPAWTPPIGSPPAKRPEPTTSGSSTAVMAIALVVSGVSLALAAVAVVVAVVAVGVVGSVGQVASSPSYGAYSLPGRLAKVPGSAPVVGSELQRSLTAVLENDDYEVDVLTCPTTAGVSQGVVTPCQATLDGDPYAVIVIFTDTAGHYLALLS